MQPTVVRIDLSRCINCSLCRRNCPTEAISYFSTGRRTHVIDPQWCIGCDICVRVCPVDCIEEDPGYAHEPGQLELAKERARAFAHRQHQVKLFRRDRATNAAATSVGRRNGTSPGHA